MRNRIAIRQSVWVILIAFLVIPPSYVLADQGGEPTFELNEDFVLPDKPEHQKLDSHLNQVVEAAEIIAVPQSWAGASLSDWTFEPVSVYLSHNVTSTVAFLKAHGARVSNVGSDYIEAYVQSSLLRSLSNLEGVLKVRSIMAPVESVTSEGTLVHGSPHWNSRGYTGAGVKVGVIDSGFEGFGALMGGELPAVAVGRCYTSNGVFTSDITDCEKDGVHGTAVSEAVIDIAPEASLYISNAPTKGDLQSTVQWMVSQGVKVINHSIGWTWFGYGDGTSPYSNSPFNAVDIAVFGGITWVNSAGNAAQETWLGNYIDSDSDDWVEFTNNYETNGFTANAYSNVIVELRWDDQWYGAARDLDLYIFDDYGNEIAYSIDGQLGRVGDVPHESVQFYSPWGGQYHIAVKRYSGVLPSWLQIRVFRGGGNLEISNPNYSIGTPAESNNPGLLAVGATNWMTTSQIEVFSSRGPTIDGRVKPDIVGADFGNSVSYGPWYGTSQSSPHVAGMAALVLQRFPDYVPHQVATYLKTNAIARGTVPNNTWGYGLAYLPILSTEPPGAPTGVSVSVSDQGIATVSWSPPASNGGSPVISYVVTSHPDEFTSTVDGSSLSTQFPDLTYGVPYTFTVEAVNSVGAGPSSSPSNSIILSAPPLPPTGVGAVAGDGQATVSWSRPTSDGGTPISMYRVVSNPGGITLEVDGSVLTAVVTGLTNGTTYTFTVSATNSSYTGDPSLPSNPVTPTGVPTAPTNVIAIAGDNLAIVSWQQPDSDGGMPITSYTVNSDPENISITVDASLLTVALPGLTNGVDYVFRVTAANDLGNSDLSAVSNSVTPAGLPGRPTDVLALAGNAEATVIWDEPLDNGGSPITGYKVTSYPDFSVATTTVFGSGGIVITASGSTQASARSIILDDSGKAIVVGYTSTYGTKDFVVIRYNPNGTMDATFGNNGMVITDFGSEDYAESVGIDSLGRILVAGYMWNGNDYDFAIARYDEAGSLDPEFGVSGTVTTDFGGGDDTAFDILIDQNNQILLVGHAYNGSDYDIAIARYSEDGNLDPNFSSDGKMMSDFGSYDYGFTSAITNAGKIVVGGAVWRNGGYQMSLVQYLSDGLLDDSFGDGGLATVDFGAGIDLSLTLEILQDGTIVAAGYSENGNDNDFAMAKFTSSGVLDTNFGTNGIVIADFGYGDDKAFGVLETSAGDILLSGYSYNGTDFDFALTQYDSDGNLDTDFGTNGKISTNVGEGDDKGYAIARLNSESILVAGFTMDGSGSNFAVIRYHANGDLDKGLRAIVKGLINGTSYVFTVKATNQVGTGDDSEQSNLVTPEGPPPPTVDIILSASSSVVDSVNTFGIDVLVEPNGLEINGVQAFINFNPAHLEVASVNLNPNSPLTVELSNQYDNDAGTVDIASGNFTGGATGTFVLGTITFSPKISDTVTEISFSSTAPRKTIASVGGWEAQRILQEILIEIGDSSIGGAPSPTPTPLVTATVVPTSTPIPAATPTPVSPISSMPPDCVAAQASVDLSIELSTVRAQYAEIFTADIIVKPNTQVTTGAQVFIDFNPNHMQVVGIELNSDSPLEILLLKTHDNTEGTADLIAGTLGVGHTAEFTLGTITFQARSVDVVSTLLFAANPPRNTVVSLSGNEIQRNLSMSYVTIGNPSDNTIPNPTPTPIPSPPQFVPTECLPTYKLVDIGLDISQESVGIGTDFTVDVMVNPNGQEITGVQAFLNYDQGYLRVTELSLDPDANLETHLTKTYNNSKGTVDIAAGSFNNQINSDFRLGTITFQARCSSGSSDISFSTQGTRQTIASISGTQVQRELLTTQVNVDSSISSSLEPILTPSDSDERFGVVLHDDFECHTGRVLDQLGVNWYTTGDGDMAQVPNGRIKVPYLAIPTDHEFWSSGQLENLESLDDSEISNLGLLNRVELAELAMASPGSYWMLISEPNRYYSDARSFYVTGRKFAPVFHHYSTYLKVGDPSSKIISPSTLNWEWTCAKRCDYLSGKVWVQSFINEYNSKYGQNPTVDVWGIVSYPIDWVHTPNSDWHVPLVVGELASMRNFLDGFGYADAPIWITKLGVPMGYRSKMWNTESNSFIPLGQYRWDAMGRYLAGVLGWLELNSASYGVEKWFVYTDWDDVVNVDQDGYMGLVLREGPGLTAPINCLGELYRSRSLATGSLNCDTLGNSSIVSWPQPTATPVPVPANHPIGLLVLAIVFTIFVTKNQVFDLIKRNLSIRG